MDARALALALALALPLTARAANLIPARLFPAAPPDVLPVPAGREMVARGCSIGALSPAREMLRQHLPIGAAAGLRGGTLAAGGLGFHADGRSLALALSFPITAGALRSSADGLGIVLSSPVGAPPPATTGCLAAAQDAGIQGACLRRGLSVVFRTYALGTASPAPTLLKPAFDRPRPMLRPRLHMETPKMFSRMASKGYITRCTPLDTTGNLTNHKGEKPKRIWNLRAAVEYLYITARSKYKFHNAVGCVLFASQIVVHIAAELQKSNFIPKNVELPEMVVAAAAMALVIGKSIYKLLKDTKDVAGLILHFIELYKEAIDSATAERNNETVAPSDASAPTDVKAPSDIAATT